MLLRNLLLALGAIASLAGLALLVLWLRQPTETAQRVPTEEILVAARPLTVGTLLGADDIAWKTMTQDIVPAGSVVRGQASDTELLGSLVQSAVPTGQPLLQSTLLRPSDGGFLSSVLRPGYRAVSIAVDASQSASGLLRPGDRVDVILTQNFGDLSPTPGHRSVGETVLQDVRIVAVDQNLSPVATARLASPTNTDARIPKTITLEVSESDAEKLLVAIQLGKVEVAVRAIETPQPDAVAAQSTAPTWGSDVSPALEAIGAVPKAAATAAAAPHETHRGITIMRGAKTEAN